MSDRFDIDKVQDYILQFALAIKAQDGTDFDSFTSSYYLTNSEYYKYRVWQYAHKICMDIRNHEIGRGDILNDIAEALRIGSNGEGALAHYSNVTKFIDNAAKNIVNAEKALHGFYLHPDDTTGYEEIRALGIGNYDVLALLAFYKDKNRYLPIRSTMMEDRFCMLGYNVQLAGHSDWQSYQHDYLDAIVELRGVLIDTLQVTTDDISLLDTHSFVWLLPLYEELAGDSLQNLDPDIQTGRLAVVVQRRGQSKYRRDLLELWHHKCAVTGCSNEALLTASHIKPWADCSQHPVERVDPYNGLPLIPNLDQAFDKGLITFNDDGTIRLSSLLSTEDAERLGIHKGTRLTNVFELNRDYLDYHRRHVFKG